MHKIIFLDVDGVLNCQKTWTGPHADSVATLCPDMCDRLQRIVQETNAIVVLSSTWRMFNGRGRKKLTKWLAERDITIHSQTKDLSIVWQAEQGTLHESFQGQVNDTWGKPHRPERGDEIALWLKEHEAEFPRLEREFVILDDDSDMLPSQRQNFVHTSFKDGLTERHAAKAIRILNDAS